MLYNFISDMAEKAPGKVAVIQGQRKATYAELRSGVSSVAAFLVKEGIIRPGDRAAIMIENSPEYIVSYFGIQKAGGISVAVNPQYSSYELKKIYNNCQPSILIAERKYLKTVLEAAAEVRSIRAIIIAGDIREEQLQAFSNRNGNIPSHIKFSILRNIIENENSGVDYPAVGPKDIASIIYTSGTTGEPKGVMLSHSNFLINANSIVEYLGLTGEDRVMVVLPFYYAYGTSLLTTAIMTGCSIVLENSFMYPNVVLEKMVEEGVTGFAGVPSTFAILLNRSNIRNYSFPKLRYITQAGGAMSPKHAAELAGMLPDTKIYIMYGQTEAAARLTYLPPEDILRKPGSIGKAIPGVMLELVKDNGMPAADGEEGEIVARGGNVMAGYWNNSEETARVLKNGKLFTGDIAVRDNEGYLKIISRRSDMIKSGAHRISPKEIEEVVLEMPEVHEAAVVGKEDEILGAVIKAVIVLKDGCALEAKSVQKHCHQKLAPFKVPREVVFVKELPKTGSGKVKKFLLEGPEAALSRTSFLTGTPFRVHPALVNNFLEISAMKYPDKTALITKEGRYSYKEIEEMSNKIGSALLSEGLEKGARVVIFLENSLEAVISLFGVLKAGCVFVMVNPTAKTEKLSYVLNNCRASALISSNRKHPVIKESCTGAPYLKCLYLEGDKISLPGDLNRKVFSLNEILKTESSRLPATPAIDIDLASIVYTSGSTGNPKGVMMTHLNMISAADSITQYLENNSGDIILNTLPLSFDYGLYQVIMGFKTGATVILEKTFLYPYEVIQTIIEEKVTGFPIVPTISAILLQMKDIKRFDFSHLRYISNTAAALPVSHIEKLQEIFPKAKIFSMYGLTECKRVSYLPPEQLNIRPESVGKPMPNTEVFIVDDNGNRVGPGITGELVVRGANVMKGYWEMPEETARKLKAGPCPGEIVLYTGDLFKMDEEGYLYFVRRKDDTIKSRGEKVSPKEIENVLYAIDGIVEAAVIGVPDDVLGEAVKAFVVVNNGNGLTENNIRKFCSQHLEDFMVPKFVEFRSELPKTDTGKIKKTALK